MNNIKPSVSIIVPAFNCERYIEQCIKSLQNQTFEDIEIIIINDGSTDSTPKLAAEFQKNDPRIIIINTENSGVSAARNTGIDAARGQYIAFVDADDHADAAMIERLVDSIFDSDMAICNYIEVVDCMHNKRETGVAPGIYTTDEIRNNFLSAYYEKGFEKHIFSSCTVLYNSAFINRNNLRFDETRHREEDYLFNFDAYCLAQNITVIDDYLYFYCRNSDSAMSRYRPDDFERMTETRVKLLKTNEQYLHFNLDGNRFDYRFLMNTICFMLLIIKTEPRPQAKRKVFEIFNNHAFREAIKHDGELSPKFKLLCKLVRLHFYYLAFALLYFRSKMDK